MLNRLKNLFDKPQTESAAKLTDNGVKLASAALLAHAARLDGRVDETETSALQNILTRGFDLDDAEAQDLLSLAQAEEEAAHDLYRWTTVINKNLQEDEKVGLIEQLWIIVLADGVVDDYEANLIRRVTGLIHVPDRLSGEARKRAETHLTE